MRECLCDYPGEDTCFDSVNSKSNDLGRTALHLAAHHNRSSCIQLLIEAGADIEAKDDEDVTPMGLASWKMDCASIQILASLNAKSDHLDGVNIQKCFTGN